MSRTRVLVGFLAALLLGLTAGSAAAQQATLLDAIGEVGYSYGRSIVKVGSWVTYRVTTRTDNGVTDSYTVTMMIAGEEEWWGEECFWVETQTTRGPATMPAATLLSSAIFDDSMPLRNVLLYQRKRISELDENGLPLQQTMRRGQSAIKSRARPNPSLTTRVDTLGTDTLKTAQGSMVCLKVRTERGFSTTAQSADSTQYGETRDVRLADLTPRVPVTGKAREETDYSVARRTWLSGHSKESSPLQVVDHLKTVMELVAFGTSGHEAQLVPPEFRRSLAEQRAVPAAKLKLPAAKPHPPAR